MPVMLFAPVMITTLSLVRGEVDGGAMVVIGGMLGEDWEEVLVVVGLWSKRAGEERPSTRASSR